MAVWVLELALGDEVGHDSTLLELKVSRAGLVVGDGRVLVVVNASVPVAGAEHGGRCSAANCSMHLHVPVVGSVMMEAIGKCWKQTCLKRADLWLGVSKQETMYTLFGKRAGGNFQKERKLSYRTFWFGCNDKMITMVSLNVFIMHNMSVLFAAGQVLHKHN